jgi:ribosomal protein L22
MPVRWNYPRKRQNRSSREAARARHAEIEAGIRLPDKVATPDERARLSPAARVVLEVLEDAAKNGEENVTLDALDERFHEKLFKPSAD